MACPTCGKTMHALGCKVSNDTFYWCPCCGTTKTCTDDVAVPALVSRCGEFEKALYGQKSSSTSAFDLRQDWNRAGVRESIRPPEERPPI
jgi:hypothetical protein